MRPYGHPEMSGGALSTASSVGSLASRVATGPTFVEDEARSAALPPVSAREGSRAGGSVLRAAKRDRSKTQELPGDPERDQWRGHSHTPGVERASQR